MTKQSMDSDDMTGDEQFLSRFNSTKDTSSKLDVSATMISVRQKLKRKSQIRSSIVASVLVLAGMAITTNVFVPEESIPNQVIAMTPKKGIQALANEQYQILSSIDPEITSRGRSVWYVFGKMDEDPDRLFSMSASAGIQNQLFETGYGMALITTLPPWECSILVGVFEDENLTRPIVSQIFGRKFVAKTVQLKLVEIDSKLESVYLVSSCRLPNSSIIFKVDKVNKQ